MNDATNLDNAFLEVLLKAAGGLDSIAAVKQVVQHHPQIVTCKLFSRWANMHLFNIVDFHYPPKPELEEEDDQLGEALHALESVVDGVRQVLLPSKVYETDSNAYYALWYWIEWGMKVHKSLDNKGD